MEDLTQEYDWDSITANFDFLHHYLNQTNQNGAPIGQEEFYYSRYERQEDIQYEQPTMYKMLHKILFISKEFKNIWWRQNIDMLYWGCMGRVGKNQNKWLKDCLGKFYFQCYVIEATCSHMSNPLDTIEAPLRQHAHALKIMPSPSLLSYVEDKDARECIIEAFGDI